MIKLVRLDYRLVHGQVGFAWVNALSIQRIIVVDDATAADEFRSAALKLAKPAGVRLNIFTVDRALAKMPKVEALGENIMIVFGTTADLRRFLAAYPAISDINYGGVANKAGSRRITDAIYLTDSEIEDTRAILAQGVRIFMQQTPTTVKEDLAEL